MEFGCTMSGFAKAAVIRRFEGQTLINTVLPSG